MVLLVFQTLNPSAKRSSKYRGVTRYRWTGRFEAHLWDKTSWNNIQRFHRQFLDKEFYHSLLASAAMESERDRDGRSSCSSQSLHHSLRLISRPCLPSKCRHYKAVSATVSFCSAIPATFNPKFWPESFNPESISSFYKNFLISGYTSVGYCMKCISGRKSEM
ncbi:hypothetical protein Q3G72_020894 [Acer saccharum]|nr:hypothetical protein Q3G72_020894 [Acer saccharum]